MTIQYLLVTFPEQCSVLADGAAVGITNHVLMLPGNEYEISISSDHASPTSQDVVLVGTSLVKPMVVAFGVADALPPAAGSTKMPIAAAPAELTVRAAVASLQRGPKTGPVQSPKTRIKEIKPATKP